MSNDVNQIKCLVWDLDNTLWKGTLLEDRNVELNLGAVKVIEELDRRGILQSIASKNNYDGTMSKLESLELANYFLYPQINWEPKSVSINRIAKNLNIGTNAFAFVDDQQFELDEVSFSLPNIITIHAKDIAKILDMPAFIPRFITEDSKIRRNMYQSDIHRNKQEQYFVGSKEDFLRTLCMKFTISRATESDLQRAEELTVRTHQLNTTGYTYSYDQLNCFRTSNSHILLIAELEDKYGPYGKIGLALIEKREGIWTIKLLLMSCRVISRGVGNVFIHCIRRFAKKQRVKKLMSEFIPTDRNRMMYMTYKFANFVEKDKKGNIVRFENDLSYIPACPDYLHVIDEFFDETFATKEV